ncbi:hypothetical protein [Pseudomonas nitroreducens]|uniref:Uncharacterized protein n=1 Tax=Pseudomonas nitroreducens TaxID=46680 RepID=A0A6G6IZ40_PSENT|nr:hypothetical protein [Pseudomonas nitroreducens]QIE88070.1 hypothetical protein G5B91_18055 [Pseudomonas nitroreducens]
MADQELLELAAKAVGLDYHIDILDGCAKLVSDGNVWNPLADDGAAFRLAVIIRPDTIRLRRIVHVSALVPYEGIRTMTENCEDNTESRAAAERRAVVRIAAEIGRAMP